MGEGAQTGNRPAPAATGGYARSAKAGGRPKGAGVESADHGSRRRCALGRALGPGRGRPRESSRHRPDKRCESWRGPSRPRGPRGRAPAGPRHSREAGEAGLRPRGAGSGAGPSAVPKRNSASISSSETGANTASIAPRPRARASARSVASRRFGKPAIRWASSPRTAKRRSVRVRSPGSRGASHVARPATQGRARRGGHDGAAIARPRRRSGAIARRGSKRPGSRAPSTCHSESRPSATAGSRPRRASSKSLSISRFRRSPETRPKAPSRSASRSAERELRESKRLDRAEVVDPLTRRDADNADQIFFRRDGENQQ